MNYMIYPGVLKVFQDNYTGINTYDENEKITEIIIAIVTSRTNVSITQIFSSIRLQNIREARQLIHYFVRKYTSYTWKKIGKTTQNHHATPIHSYKTIKNGIEYDQKLNRKVNMLNNEILKLITNTEEK